MFRDGVVDADDDAAAFDSVGLDPTVVVNDQAECSVEFSEVVAVAQRGGRALDGHSGLNSRAR